MSVKERSLGGWGAGAIYGLINGADSLEKPTTPGMDLAQRWIEAWV